MNTTDVKKTDNIITLEHVTFQYNKEEGTPVQVLKDISLDIQEGVDGGAPHGGHGVPEPG